MRASLLFSLFLFAVAARATPVQTVTPLRDLGVVHPDRLAGLAPQKDYYLPLPARDFDPAGSRVTVELTASPFLDPESVVSVLVNDREVATGKVKPGGSVTLTGKIPPGTKADDPNNNILKLTVKAALALPRGPERDAALTSAQAWIEVLPASAFICAFDQDAADWRSIARLPLTIRPRVAILRPTPSTPEADRFGLRLVAWVARLTPRGELFFAEPVPADADRFVIEAPSPAAAPIEITAEGLGRTIHLRAGTEAESDAILATLQSLAVLRLPGSAWVCAPAGKDALPPSSPAAVGLESLDPNATAPNRGRGDTSRSIHFERSAVRPSSGDIAFRLKGRLASPAAATFATFLNGRLVFSRHLEPGAFDENIALPASALRGGNELTVTAYPDADGDTLLWQLDPASSLRATGHSAAAPELPTDLLEAARQHFAGGACAVRLGAPADWPVAAAVVAWLQRVNPSAPLDPRLVPSLPAGMPAILVGTSGKTPPAGAQVPLTFEDGRIAVHSKGVTRAIGLAPGTSAGIWQLAYLDPATPAILADGWGPAGANALQAVSRQLADSVWIESGDVIVGDGVTPPLTFATRERAFAAPEETSAPEAASAVAPASVRTPPFAEIRPAGPPWRWWLIGALWVLLSAVVLWIFNQTRKHAAQ